jgi:hypothetical protein
VTEVFEREFVVAAFLFEPAEGIMDERQGAEILGGEGAV